MDSSGRELNEGDLLEFRRSFFYNHWGVYVGNGYVVHATGEPNYESYLPNSLNTMIGSSSALSGNVSCDVRKQPLEEVANTDLFYVNNLLDNDNESAFPPEEISTRAHDAWKKGSFKYHLISNNCEHFATNMRYGEPISRQVEGITNIACAILYIVYLFFKWLRDSKNIDQFFPHQI